MNNAQYASHVRWSKAGAREKQAAKMKSGQAVTMQHAVVKKYGGQTMIAKAAAVARTPEANAKRSASLKGRAVGDRVKRRETMLGHSVSPETRAKIAKKLTGRVRPQHERDKNVGHDERKDRAYAAAQIPLWRFTEAELRERPGDAWRRLLKGLETRILTAA